MSVTNITIDPNNTKYKYSQSYIKSVLFSYISFGIFVGALYYLLPSRVPNTDYTLHVAIMAIVVIFIAFTETSNNKKYILYTNDEGIAHLNFYSMFMAKRSAMLSADWKNIYAVRHIKKYYMFDRVILFSSYAVIQIKIKGVEDYQKLVSEIIEKVKALSDNVEIDDAVYSLIE